MDKVANRKAWLQCLAGKGWDGLLSELQVLCPDLELYSVSQDWAKSADYILKAKGARGDLIVEWLRFPGTAGPAY